MTKITHFRVQDESFNYVDLAVDSTILTVKLATEINGFWGNWKSRLSDEDGDVKRTVVRLFGASAICCIQSDGGIYLNGQAQDHCDSLTKQVLASEGDGWPDFANLGIRIVGASVDAASFDTVTVSELTV